MPRYVGQPRAVLTRRSCEIQLPPRPAGRAECRVAAGRPAGANVQGHAACRTDSSIA
jgi:hypothetical protein